MINITRPRSSRTRPARAPAPRAWGRAPRARFGAARLAAAVGLVCGLAVFAGAARAADEPPASRTPLADTGLWEPPVLQPDRDSFYKRIPIPADEGLAAFYGVYKPESSYEIVLIDRIVLGPRDIHFFGTDDRSVRDSTVQYKVLHQGENYVLVKYRHFPKRRIFTGRKPEKMVGFGLLGFENNRFQITGCKPAWLPMFEPDTYGQTPERDIADLIESGVDEIMRQEFSEGELFCGGGSYFGAYSRHD